GPRGQVAEIVQTGLLAAAALTATAAVCGVLVELTNFGAGIDAAVAGIVARLAAVPLAAAAGWWVWRLRG
ncbi:MAG: hypothetical protein JO337_04420, partial [Acidimicrobiales bacterium]|nr:hypothetical protein [Acidimicrobiales bacterium]